MVARPEHGASSETSAAPAQAETAGSAPRRTRAAGRGLVCPHCEGVSTLRVRWTRVKGDALRRDVFRCLACGEPVSGWLTLDPPPAATKEPPAS